MQWLLVKYVLKELLLYLTLEENCPILAPKDVNIWKPADQVDIKKYIKRKQPIRKAKYTFFVMKLWFCMQLQLHILWKPLPLKGIFVQYTVLFDPSYIVENQDESIRRFGLLLDRLKV